MSENRIVTRSAFIRMQANKWAKEMLELQKDWAFYLGSSNKLPEEMNRLHPRNFFSLGEGFDDFMLGALSEITDECKAHPYWAVLKHSLKATFGIDFEYWLEPSYLGDFKESED